MIYTELTKKALKVCFDVHKDQVDKSGMPYVFHPFHLAEQMVDEDTTIVALLHDVVEDSDLNRNDLLNMGFNKEIVEAIRLLTYTGKKPYMEYIKDLSMNPIARTVKLADLKHNSDLTRLDVVSERDLSRYEKYKMAICFLEGIDNAKEAEEVVSKSLDEAVALAKKKSIETCVSKKNNVDYIKE